MGGKRDSVEVRISQRTMWLGEKAFPLQNASAVQLLEVGPARGRIIARFAKQGALWMAFGILGLCAGLRLPWTVIIAYELLVLAGLIVITIRLIHQLTRSALHVLRITFAGRASEVIASRDRDQILQLQDRVVAAIDDPTASYQVQVDRVVGDIDLGGSYGDRMSGANGPPGGPDFPTEP